MSKLRPYDLAFCVSRLTKGTKKLLKAHPDLIVAGGFIRAVVANEQINDIDVFSPSLEKAEEALKTYCFYTGAESRSVIRTDNAFTVNAENLPVQFIHRWVFSSIDAVLKSFDFSIASAAVFWNAATQSWDSAVHEDFYPDLAAKRLIYLAPIRHEDAGGSMLRVLKFYQRGYRIPLESLGKVIARLIAGVEQRGVSIDNQELTSKIVTGLLRQVDPLASELSSIVLETEINVSESGLADGDVDVED